MEQKYHAYKCPKNCHVRVYPVWVGEDAEKCPKCGEWMLYKGHMTHESINQMQMDSKRAILEKLKNSKKQLKKK